MNYEQMIGWRYLFAKKGNFLVSIITVISIVGVTLGVTALLTVMAVVSGFENDFRKKILGNNAHLIVVTAGQRFMSDYEPLLPKIRQTKGVTGASPFLYEEVLLRGKSGRTTGALLYGVDPVHAGSVTSLDKDMQGGSLADLKRQGEYPGIIVGAEIAQQTLFLLPDDPLDILSPSGELSPFGLTPKLRRFQLVGQFKSGLYEYDAHSAYIDLTQAQRFFNKPGQVSGIQIGLKDFNQAQKVAQTLAKTLGERYLVRTWMELNRDLFSAFKLEKTVFFIVLTMIILVAAFNIIATLILLVTEKQREVAILKAMGATSRSIMKIFVTTGLTVGGVGTVLGLGLATTLIFVLRDYFPFPLNANVYQVENLPIVFNLVDFILVTVAALMISFLATLYPSIKAATLDPVEGLRYE